MTGSDRRADIIQQIKESRTPVSGTKRALRYEVSRQVIVQDIALIRASGYDIISTNRGYILNAPKSVSRDFKVQHTDEQLEEEHRVSADSKETLDMIEEDLRQRGFLVPCGK